MRRTHLRVTTATSLAIMTAVPCAVVAQSPIESTPARLEAQMLDAAEAGDFDKAHELGLRLIAAAPDADLATYKLACIFARAGKNDRAVEWLKNSAQCGFRFEAKFLRDEDLDAIRSHPQYGEVLEHIRRNAAASLETFKVRAAKDAVVLTRLPPRHAPSRPAALVVALHGYGGDAAGMIRAWKKPAGEVGAVLIAPQALERAGAGFSWTVSYETEFLVLRAIEETKKTLNIDAQRIVLTGFSQGGHSTFYVALRHPELLAGAIPMSGAYDPRTAALPARLNGKFPRFVIVNGALDPQADNNREAAKQLENLGAPVLLKIYEGVGHAFPPKADQELAAALRFVLP